MLIMMAATTRLVVSIILLGSQATLLVQWDRCQEPGVQTQVSTYAIYSIYCQICPCRASDVHGTPAMKGETRSNQLLH